MKIGLMKTTGSIQEVLDATANDVAIESVFGEPVEKGGSVRIPVNKVSLWGIVPRKPVSAETLGSGQGIRKRTTLVGHIVVGPSGVHWHPRVGIAKLALASLALLASLFALVKASREPSLSP